MINLQGGYNLKMDEYMRAETDMENRKCPVSSSCIPQETVIKNVRLAAAYVPFQKLCNIFSPIEAFKAGTIFPELYSPYDGKYKKIKAAKRGEDEL